MTPDQVTWIAGFVLGIWLGVPFAMFLAFSVVPAAIDAWAFMRRVGHRRTRGR